MSYSCLKLVPHREKVFLNYIYQTFRVFSKISDEQDKQRLQWLWFRRSKPKIHTTTVA